jgi:Flp pilus assembly protein TadD
MVVVQARQLFLQAAALDGADADTFLQVSMFLEAQGDKDEAIKYSLQAVELEPENGTVAAA